MHVPESCKSVACRHYRRASLAALLLLGLSAPLDVVCAILPESPRIYLDTTYSPPPGNTIVVNAGGNLQAALDNAVLGDTIVLQAGATFIGPFTLPKKTAGSGWIHIRSSNYASLPPAGSRVSAADAPNMPKLAATSSGSAIRTNAGAHHFRFVGIEFKPVAGNFVYSLVEIGAGETVASDLPHDITFDRCYVHADPAVGGRRGIAMNGKAVAVVDSHVSDFKEIGADTQALWTYNSPGPLKLVNNYLEASGENFMAGGADPRIPNLVPSDIEVRGNHFSKPLAWLSQPWSVKNLFELKNAQRVLIEGNIFENNWPQSQTGFAILFTPRNQDGTAPWSVTQDITFRLNKVLNVGQGFNISGKDDIYASQPTRRVLIENNLIEVTTLNGAQGRIYQTLLGPTDVTIRHDTSLITTSGGTTAFHENSPRADGFDFRDNLLSSGTYGFIGTGTAAGYSTLDTHFVNYSFVKNAVIGGSGSYPPDTYFPANPAAVGFTNFAAGDYRLSSASPFKAAASDGKDLGADIVALDTATACVRNGQCGSAPPDATPPAISAVGASSVTSSQAVIGWATNESADTQVDYGPTSAYGSTTTLQPALLTSHAQALGGLAAASLYHYRVRSRDGNGNLAMSGNFTFTTLAAAPPADTTPPVLSAVTNAVVSSQAATITWATNEAADSQVQYGPTSAYGSMTPLDAALVASHAQTLGGLSASTVYHYRVRSRDAAGNLATSAEFTFTTLGSADTTAPGIPTGLVLTDPTRTRITLGWNAATDNVAVTGYRLDVALDSGFTRFVPAYKGLNVGNVTSFRITGLKHRTTYYVRLRAYDAPGNTSAYSETASARTAN